MGPAAHLGPDACPLLPPGLPCQRPLLRRRSTVEPGLKPTPRRALATNSPLLSWSQGGESPSSDARVSKCPLRVPHFKGPPPLQGRKPWSLFQKPNLHASTLRAWPVEFFHGDERHQDGPRDFPAAPPASPHPAGARQMLQMGTLSLTHQSPRGLWDAGPSVMDKGQGELGGRTDSHEQTQPPPPSPGLP